VTGTTPRSGDGPLVPGIPGFSYADLFDPARLRDLSDLFDREVAAADPELAAAWSAYRAEPGAPRDPREVSELHIRLGTHLSPFVARLFGVEAAAAELQRQTLAQDPIFRFRVDFLRRRVAGKVKPESVDAAARAADDAAVDAWLHAPAAAQPPYGIVDRELALTGAVSELLDLEAALAAPAATATPQDPAAGFGERTARLRARAARIGLSLPDDAAVVAHLLAVFARWTAVRAEGPGQDSARAAAVRGWVSFHLPHPMNYQDLVHTLRPQAPQVPELRVLPEEKHRRRDGFGLTDARMNARQVLGEVHYCVYCHDRDKDSCSKGLRDKTAALKKNPLGVTLNGCPLDEKISEMHTLARRGDPVGALAMVMADNPMCPGTGHRICNDCMKGCIYQTQDPVNIPQIETGVLTTVLDMPWGVEIYGLLTRWNPLNAKRPYALPYNGRNVLVVGLGPAGYTLAHHLMNEGFGVVGVDGLKIEPLPEAWTGGPGGADGQGGWQLPQPIRSFSQIQSALDARVLAGFGGVSEYGITVRWDKNFLTLLHLTLARRQTMRMFGGVRFGGTLDAAEAWRLGFHHIAIAAGAGRPTLVGMKNNLLRGVRQASDFLMALQLTGAFKRDSLASLQVRLPAIVVGGGLTAIATATETAAYYPVQVEKLLERFEALRQTLGEEAAMGPLDPEERGILAEFLEHGRAVRAERARAVRENRPPDFAALVHGWGGVAIAYRKAMEDSPAYRLNHEEVEKALEEGIAFMERLDPAEAHADTFGALAAVTFRRGDTEETLKLPARTLLIAAGTTPNVTYEKERPGSFVMDGRKKFFQPHKVERVAGDGWRLTPAADGESGFFTSHESDGRFITFYGDNHPIYAGNVVKAMASARDGFPHVVALFRDETARLKPADQPARDAAWSKFTARLSDLLDAHVHEVRRLTETIVEVVVRAPLAAREFHPGQFYRLQNYERDAPLVRGTRLTMEGLALTGAWTDPEKGLLSLIVLEMGGSSRLCATLKPGQRVIVMGPTGSPTEIPEGEKVLLAGGGLGNAVLFSIARALKDNRCRVVYFAGYKRGEDLFKREEIEAACDQIVWSTDAGEEIVPQRPQDLHFRGNIVQAMRYYAEGRLGQTEVPLDEVDRLIAIGSDRMMAAVKEARHGVLAPYLRTPHAAIGSINSPMQCMMKEVCAQCLQRHVDPETGRESFVFSCFNQDQKLDEVDFKHLAQRLRQNTVQEKLTNLWVGLALRDTGERQDLAH